MSVNSQITYFSDQGIFDLESAPSLMAGTRLPKVAQACKEVLLRTVCNYFQMHSLKPPSLLFKFPVANTFLFG